MVFYNFHVLSFMVWVIALLWRILGCLLLTLLSRVDTKLNWLSSCTNTRHYRINASWWISLDLLSLKKCNLKKGKIQSFPKLIFTYILPLKRSMGKESLFFKKNNVKSETFFFFLNKVIAFIPFFYIGGYPKNTHLGPVW